MKTKLLFLAAAAAVFASVVHAQTAASGPQLVITWKALDSAAPAAYAGKVLPGVNSQMSASVTAVSGGNLVSLKPYTIYWYLDDDFLAGGVGKQNITFTAPGHTEIASLRVQIADYAGGPLINTAHIEIADPRAVIVAPYAGRSFSGATVLAQAVPYFFKTSDLNKLSYQWSVNGQAVTARENPQDLTINLSGAMPNGYLLSVDLNIQQSDDPLTSAVAAVTLTKSSQ